MLKKCIAAMLMVMMFASLACAADTGTTGTGCAGDLTKILTGKHNEEAPEISMM